MAPFDVSCEHIPHSNWRAHGMAPSPLRLHAHTQQPQHTRAHARMNVTPTHTHAQHTQPCMPRRTFLRLPPLLLSPLPASFLRICVLEGWARLRLHACVSPLTRLWDGALSAFEPLPTLPSIPGCLELFFFFFFFFFFFSCVSFSFAHSFAWPGWFWPRFSVPWRFVCYCLPALVR
jgi:hypothetical protein